MVCAYVKFLKFIFSWRFFHFFLRPSPPSSSSGRNEILRTPLLIRGVETRCDSIENRYTSLRLADMLAHQQQSLPACEPDCENDNPHNTTTAASTASEEVHEQESTPVIGQQKESFRKSLKRTEILQRVGMKEK